MHNIEKKNLVLISEKTLLLTLVLFFTKKYRPLRICGMIHETVLEFREDVENLVSFEN